MLGLDASYDYTPRTMSKLIHAAVHSGSYEQASHDVQELAEAQVSGERIRRLVKRIGGERLAERAAAVQRFMGLPLPAQQGSPGVPIPPVVSVQMDGGRVQIRDRRQPPGQREGDSYWRELKVGDLRTFQSEVHAVDPCPQLPEVFLDPVRMREMVREIKGFSQPAEAENTACSAAEASDEAALQQRRERPQPLVLSVVATRENVHRFGELLASAAYERGFHAAERKAFVADGAEANWTVWRTHFSPYTPIVDFVHAVSYVYAAAHAGAAPSEGWTTYVEWAQWLWEGNVAHVIAALEARQPARGEPAPQEPDHSPHQQTATTLGYLRNQQSRLHYAEYRKQGLPTTSSYVESTVKRLHRRVKGTEKFWSEGLENLLILAADHLSDTRPLDRYWKTRRPTAIRCYHSAA